MDIKDFEDYNFADIPADAVSNITKLEQKISSEISKDVVLIAYQPKREVSE